MEINHIPFLDIVDDITSKFNKIPNKFFFSEGEYPIIDQGANIIAGYTNDKSVITDLGYPVIIFGDHTRILKFINFPFAIGADGVKVISVYTEKAYPLYVFYFLKFLKIPNAGYSRHFKFLKEKKIALPKDIDNQKRIAKVLSQCEALIQKRKESIDLLEELLRSTFLEMFGIPETNPFGWEEKEFGDFTHYIGDIGSNGSNDTVSQNLVMSNIEDYAIMIRTTNLNANDFTKNLKFISKKTYDFFSKSKIYGGEIIMNKIGSPGKFWIMPNLNRPVSLGLNQFVIRLKDLNTNYIKYFLSTNFSEVNIRSRTQGATTKSITKSAVRSLPVLYPPMELQIEFSELVDKVEAIKNKFNESLKELENLYGSISQRAFNGELDLSKVDISDMEDSKKKELEEVEEEELVPIEEAFWDGNYNVQNYDVKIGLIIKNDFAETAFNFGELVNAISERGVYVPYESIKKFVFKSLEGEDALLVQMLDEEVKNIVFKLK